MEFKFNFETFDPKVTKQTQLAHDLWKQKTATDELSTVGVHLTTAKGVAMWKEKIDQNGVTELSSIRINPQRGIYLLYQAERHELTHFMLLLYGHSERTPDDIDDHGLGGWMHYGTRYVDANGNTTKFEGVDNSLSPEAAAKIIKGVPRVPDLIQEN